MRKLPEEILFDSRLVERHIRQGLTTRQDYEDWLARRPDVAGQGESLNFDGTPQAAEEPVAPELPTSEG